MHSQKKQSWRDVLPIHPAADQCPLMSEIDPKALKELGESINRTEPGFQSS
jgi:hypothetical protein